MKLKCDYCNKDAIQIWYGSGLIYTLPDGKIRPVLHPLCEDHHCSTAFIPIRKENKDEKR